MKKCIREDIEMYPRGNKYSRKDICTWEDIKIIKIKIKIYVISDRDISENKFLYFFCNIQIKKKYASVTREISFLFLMRTKILVCHLLK